MLEDTSAGASAGDDAAVLLGLAGLAVIRVRRGPDGGRVVWLKTVCRTAWRVRRAGCSPAGPGPALRWGLPGPGLGQAPLVLQGTALSADLVHSSRCR